MTTLEAIGFLFVWGLGAALCSIPLFVLGYQVGHANGVDDAADALEEDELS